MSGKEEMKKYKIKAQAYRDENKHEEDRQRKQRDEMAMKLVDSGVTMMPYEQCDYENLPYIRTTSYSDSVPKESQPTHDCLERNSTNNSHINHCADNAEHWKRPFGSNEYITSNWTHGYNSQGNNHEYDAWYDYQRKAAATIYNGNYHHYHEDESSRVFFKATNV